MTEPELTLAGDFPAASEADWLALVDKVLKGGDFESVLVSHSRDGLPIRPLYVRGDEGSPAAPRLTRLSVAGDAQAGWDIRTEHVLSDPADTNRAILDDLEQGATSIALHIGGTNPHGEAQTLEDLDQALDGVHLDLAPIALDASADALAAAAALIALWQRRAIAPDAALAAFNVDPLGALARGGVLPGALDTALAQAADLAALTAARFANVTALSIDTSPYHDAGASEAQELAAALATGAAYLRALDAAGLTIAQACAQLTLSLAVDCDMLLGIAKLRAARRLWARLAEACGADAQAQRITLHARTSAAMMTQRDPWVNMLRTTMACFTAAVAGADAVTVRPFTAAIGGPTAFARRMARNTQLVLDEESGLGHVLDPAAGAWALESLTEELARTAWSKFQAIEAAGGMAQSLLQGDFLREISTTDAQRRREIAARTAPITGVSAYPHLEEEPVEALPAPPSEEARADRIRMSAIAAAPGLADRIGEAGGANARIDACVAAAKAGHSLPAIGAALASDGPLTSCLAMPLRRWAEPFELLRDASDAHLAKTGARPKVFLANLGTIAQFNARATFAGNFFEAGGILALSGDGGDDLTAIIAAFRDSGARHAVLCGPDALYELHAANLTEALKGAGAEGVYLAGKPNDVYDRAGVDRFIHVGSDALSILREALERQGVELS